MKNELKVLALIPARGGSKRLPGKNIKDFAGKPLINWTIEAALKSKFINTVLVSTDCEEIADIAKKAGAEVPFIRPSQIAQDKTEIPDVINHCLNFYKTQGVEFTHILLLQPTCPLRKLEDIENSIQMLIDKNAAGIFSVCEVDHSPLWANTLPENGSFDEFLRKDIAGVRSQELPTYYRVNGAIYLLDLNLFKKNNSLFHHANTFAYVMDRSHSVDIDVELDFAIAEAILKGS